MGLIEHTANFFIAEDVNNVCIATIVCIPIQDIVSCRFLLAQWTIASGNRQCIVNLVKNAWAKLHHGPMWSVTHTQVSQQSQNQRTISEVPHS